MYTQILPLDIVDIAKPTTEPEEVVEPDLVTWPAVDELTSVSPMAGEPPLVLALTWNMPFITMSWAAPLPTLDVATPNTLVELADACWTWPALIVSIST